LIILQGRSDSAALFCQVLSRSVFSLTNSSSPTFKAATDTTVDFFSDLSEEQADQPHLQFQVGVPSFQFFDSVKCTCGETVQHHSNHFEQTQKPLE